MATIFVGSFLGRFTGFTGDRSGSNSAGACSGVACELAAT
jgi:hypothetical protein